MKYVLEFEPDELAIAMEWHGGQTSMLYAIASTGKLALGTRRPDPEMDDDHWFVYLCEKLEAEALAAASESIDGADIAILERIAEKAQTAGIDTILDSVPA